MFYQVKAVRALYGDVSEVYSWCLPKGSLLGEMDVVDVEEVCHFDLLNKVIVDGCKVVYTFLVVVVQVDAGFPKVSEEWTRASVWPLLPQVLINGFLKALIALGFVASHRVT